MSVPPDTVARIGYTPGADEYFVFLAVPPTQAGMHLLGPSPNTMTVLLTHDSGVQWTDRHGELLAEEALHRGCAVIMQLATFADALAAHARAERLIKAAVLAARVAPRYFQSR
jgi:hypothetical protein